MTYGIDFGTKFKKNNTMANYREYFTLIGYLEKNEKSEYRFTYLPMFKKQRTVPFDEIMEQKTDMFALLLGENNREILRVPLSTSHLCSGEESLDEMALRGYIPYIEETKEIQFIFENEKVGGFKVPEEKPELRILSKFERTITQKTVELNWSVNYRGSEKVQAKVLYSNDDGKTWQPLGNRTEKQEMIIKASDLRGGRQCCFAVKVSDGFNTVVAESERFFVPDLPPQVLILDPLDGETYESERSLLLNGQAYNPNTDEEITDQLLWESSMDGKLAEGQLAQVQLTKGEHKITLNTQQGKLKSDVTISITVK